ncbi:hypothetical protein Tco_0870430 [Tanacetum coccineum]
MQECTMKLEPLHDIPLMKVETFTDKVKRRITEDNENREKNLRKLESEPVNTPLVNAIRKTPDYTRRLQELVSNKTKIKELSMVKLNARCSAVLPNELPPKEKDPGSFILPCLGNPRPINMMIEMADSIEDDKVPIILGRPMLATAHAKIEFVL